MRLFKRKKLAPTGKVINMNETWWGHSYNFSGGPDSKGRWSAAIWNASGASVGDEITYRSDSGVVKSIITKAESAPSVWDMYFIDARITHLNDERVGL